MEKGRHYPDWIEAIVDLSRDAPSPEIFRRWGAISAIAGALGRTCWYNRGKYNIGTNMYVVLVGGPGTGKNTALYLPYNYVFDRLSVPLSARPKGDGSDLWTDDWKKYQISVPLRMAYDRLTAEKLIKSMAENLGIGVEDMSNWDDGIFFDSSVTILAGEIGTFLRDTERNLVLFLTEVWNYKEKHFAETVMHGTKFIRAPCVNFIAGATVSQLKDNLPPNAKDQGFLSRLMPIYYKGDSYEEGARTDSYATKDIEWLRFDLASIANLRGEFDWESKELLDEADSWSKAGCPPKPRSSNMEEYCNRRFAHCIKIAMAVSAARSNDMIITREVWHDAQQLMFDAERHMPEALESFGISSVGQIFGDLHKVVEEHPRGMLIKDFNRHALRICRNVTELAQVTDRMSDAGLITIDKEGGLIFPCMDD